jgi:hypothetical protein
LYLTSAKRYTCRTLRTGNGETPNLFDPIGEPGLRFCTMKCGQFGEALAASTFQTYGDLTLWHAMFRADVALTQPSPEVPPPD